jgi:hypothetical protein
MNSSTYSDDENYNLEELIRKGIPSSTKKERDESLA